jgi:hypothetical protein
MKGVITIFALPQELEDLALTLYNLKRNSIYLDLKNKYSIDVTMCLSDELTDWNKSKLPKDYIEQRTIELCQKFLDWCEYDLNVEKEDSILGCVSQRRYSLNKHKDADFFIWLDCDFIFKDITLQYMTYAYENLKLTGVDNFIITPQFVRQWDSTWDILVNDKFLNHPLYYHELADVYVDTLPQNDEILIKKINNIKFAGGWFTLISGKLLKEITIPESLGHYGLEDNFVIECSKILKQKGVNISQFVLENLVIGESYTHRPNETIKSFIVNRNRKSEFTQIAHNNFPIELNKFYERSNSSINSL